MEKLYTIYFAFLQDNGKLEVDDNDQEIYHREDIFAKNEEEAIKILILMCECTPEIIDILEEQI